MQWFQVASCPSLPPSTGLVSASASSQRKERDSGSGSWVVLTPKHGGKSHAVSRDHRDEPS